MPHIQHTIPSAGGGGAVTSVATRTGDVVLAESDITNLTTDLAAKAPLASPALTGTPTVPTATQGTNTTQAASTAMVHSEAVLLAPLASPTFTGTVVLPEGNDAAAGTASRRTLGTGATQAAQGSLAAPLASPTFTGTVGVPNAAAATSAAAFGQLNTQRTATGPSGSLFETFPRVSPGAINVTAGTGSATLQLYAVYIPTGTVVGHITFLSGTTALSVGLNQWFGLYDSSRVQLATTTDDTSTAWSASTTKTLAIATIASGASSTFTTTYSGLHYVGIMVKATTPPSLLNVSTNTTLSGIAPVSGGSSDTAQTTPPAFPHTANAITATGSIFYAYGAA